MLAASPPSWLALRLLVLRDDRPATPLTLWATLPQTNEGVVGEPTPADAITGRQLKTILYHKQHALRRDRLPPSQQVLRFGEATLEDGAPISTHRLHDGAVLRLSVSGAWEGVVIRCTAPTWPLADLEVRRRFREGSGKVQGREPTWPLADLEVRRYLPY